MLEIDISTKRCPDAILRVDECDRHLIEGVRWTPDARPCGVIYAHRQFRNAPKEYLHRAIMNPSPGMVVDHIDRDGLNNCRSNLRIVPQSVNHWNRGGHGSSPFKGVTRKRLKWSASIRKISLGVFPTEEEAALAYDAAALALGYDRTGLNFPDRNTRPSVDPRVRRSNRFGEAGIRQLSSGRFNVRVMRDGRKIGLGTFDTLEQAIRAKQRDAA